METTDAAHLAHYVSPDTPHVHSSLYDAQLKDDHHDRQSQFRQGQYDNWKQQTINQSPEFWQRNPYDNTVVHG